MWSVEADAELIRLKSAGLSFGQIAKQMNVTRNAAISRFQRINGKIYGHSRWALRLRQQAEAELSTKRRAERQAKLNRQTEELRREFAPLTREDRNLRILTARAAGVPRRVIAQAAGLSIARTDQIISAGRAKAARQAEANPSKSYMDGATALLIRLGGVRLTALMTPIGEGSHRAVFRHGGMTVALMTIWARVAKDRDLVFFPAFCLDWWLIRGLKALFTEKYSNFNVIWRRGRDSNPR
jgi:hypothetical protein